MNEAQKQATENVATSGTSGEQLRIVESMNEKRMKFEDIKRL